MRSVKEKNSSKAKNASMWWLWTGLSCLTWTFLPLSHATTFTFQQATCHKGRYSMQINHGEICTTTVSQTSSASTWFHNKWSKVTSSSSSSSQGQASTPVDGAYSYYGAKEEEGGQEQQQDAAAAQLESSSWYWSDYDKQNWKAQEEEDYQAWKSSSQSSASASQQQQQQAAGYYHAPQQYTQQQASSICSSGTDNLVAVTGTVGTTSNSIAFLPSGYAFGLKVCRYHSSGSGSWMCLYEQDFSYDDIALCHYLSSVDGRSSCPNPGIYSLSIVEALPSDLAAQLSSSLYDSLGASYSVYIDLFVYRTTTSSDGEPVIGDTYEQCTLQFTAHASSSSSSGTSSSSYSMSAAVAALLVAGGALAWRRRRIARRRGTLHQELDDDMAGSSNSGLDHVKNQHHHKTLQTSFVELADRHSGGSSAAPFSLV
ncbi:hypothetical protein ACA910_020364 [Epithemia clementina (nom. ined.)]